MALLGILLALGALFSWGVGDFFIQKATKKVGTIGALFFIGLFGALALFPFAVQEFSAVLVSPTQLLLLILAAGIGFFAALFDFEALRQGKIAIVEPVIGLELPLTIGFSVVLVGERLTLSQSLAALMVFIGITLAVTTYRRRLHYRRILEKGVILAGIGAVGLAFMNFIVGVSSRETSPLLTIWFIHTAAAVLSGLYLLLKKEWSHVLRAAKHARGVVLMESLLDTAGWIFYATATAVIPISIATTVSESYIALAALLGIFVNREKLRRHQLFGALLTFAGVLLLSSITGGP